VADQMGKVTGLELIRRAAGHWAARSRARSQDPVLVPTHLQAAGAWAAGCPPRRKPAGGQASRANRPVGGRCRRRLLFGRHQVSGSGSWRRAAPGPAGRSQKQRRVCRAAGMVGRRLRPAGGNAPRNRFWFCGGPGSTPRPWGAMTPKVASSGDRPTCIRWARPVGRACGTGVNPNQNGRDENGRLQAGASAESPARSYRSVQERQRFPWQHAYPALFRQRHAHCPAAQFCPRGF